MKRPQTIVNKQTPDTSLSKGWTTFYLRFN